VRAEGLWLAGQHVAADAELSAIYARTTSSGERAAATELTHLGQVRNPGSQAGTCTPSGSTDAVRPMNC
jgi:hypothetical protein